MIEHHKLFYTDLADPVAMLKRGRGGGKLARFLELCRSSGARRAGSDRRARMKRRGPIRR